MDKAVLKTLVYADIFKFPLKAWEVQKWLIKQSASLTQVERSLKRLVNQQKVGTKKGFYYLNGRSSLVGIRLKREKYSKKLARKLFIFTQVAKRISWIKLVGISGTLAMNNADKGDDLDLLIVTKTNRLWLTRLICLFILEILGQRRKRSDKVTQSAGKVCPNLFLEIESLSQTNKSLYIAHEILQLRLVWQRDNTYDAFLAANEWATSFLPNWVGPKLLKVSKRKQVVKSSRSTQFFDRLEVWASKYQRYLMGKPSGAERINQTSLYLHPEDYHPKVLKLYNQKIQKLL